MNIISCILTQNDCYKTKQTIVPKGVMVHSTGANNPTVRRYAQPTQTDPKYAETLKVIGENKNRNDWNRANTGKCVHAFIGKLADGSIGTAQCLPWNHRGWHAGTGTSGRSANNTHISFEICEDGLTDKTYFDKVYKEAVEVTAYLCKTYNLNPLADGVVICHKEGYRRGVASGHADVEHWFPKHGKTMDDFRKDVSKIVNGGKIDSNSNTNSGNNANNSNNANNKTDNKNNSNTVANNTVNSKAEVEPAKSVNKAYNKIYTVKPKNGLNMRCGAGVNKTILTALTAGTKFRCYGYYTSVNGVDWLYGVANGVTGYCSLEYLG